MSGRNNLERLVSAVATELAPRALDSWPAARGAGPLMSEAAPVSGVRSTVRLTFAVRRAAARELLEVLDGVEWPSPAGTADSVHFTAPEAALSAIASARTTSAGSRVAEQARVLLAAADSARRAPAAPRLMGVVNATPDSFSDGGAFASAAEAIAHGLALAEAGAELLDVGGESTRPGAPAVPVAEELARVVPVVQGLARETRVALSIDTTKSAVARAALDAGATIVNDVSAGLADPAMLQLVAERGATFVAMHMRGTPRTMQDAPHYADVVADVAEALRERARACLAAGIAPESLWLDPGIGFGKTLEHNLALLARLGELRSLGAPLLLGVSRKSFLGRLTGRDDPRQREWATAAAVSACIAAGAELLRVHDVAAMLDVARVAHSLARARAVPSGDPGALAPSFQRPAPSRPDSKR